MRRSFVLRFLVCVVPVLASLLVIGMALYRSSAGAGGFKLGVDLVGGTILVYELDSERMQLQSGGDSAVSIDELVESLKRRIDPASQKNITIRKVGSTRVEIIMPYGAAAQAGKAANTANDVQGVRDLIGRTGQMEFRILANEADDKPAIDAARAFFANVPKSPSDQARLARQAELGLPPPAPEGEFALSSRADDRARYAWVELGKDELDQYGLANRWEKGPQKSQGGYEVGDELWKKMDAARKAGEPHLYSNDVYQKGGRGDKYTFFLYSRPFVKRGGQDLVKEGKKYEYFVLTRVTAFGPDGITPVGTSNYHSVVVGKSNVTLSASSGTGGNFKPAINFRLGGDGPRMFENMTTASRPTGPKGNALVRSLAIVLDEQVISAPSLQAVISDNGQITGNFTQDDVTSMVRILKSGALPAILKPEPVSTSNVGPTLGADTIRSGSIAVGLAFVAVLAFMVWYYSFAGFVASVALFANLLLTVAFMVLVNATFTLPGLAGLVLTLGMAVDANVLIYERVREETDRGANLITAIRNGYDRAFPTIIDTHLSSIFTAVVLYAVGNDQLKGFGISLTVGLVISLFTSLYITRAIFDYWMQRSRPTSLRMRRIFTKTNYDFMGIRRLMFTVTGILTILGLALFLVRGSDGLNVDFRGGTVYGGRLISTKAQTIDELRDRVSETAQRERLAVSSVKEVSSGGGEGYRYEVAYADRTALIPLANKPAGETPEARAETVRGQAARLPDVSVEQIFVSSDQSATGTSRYFTVRTTEREENLVRVMIERLFRDGAESMLELTTMTGYKRTADAYEATFSAPVATGYIGSALGRQLGVRAGAGLQPFTVEGVPNEKESEANRDGRYTTMRVVPLMVPTDPNRLANIVGVAVGTPISFATGPLSVAARAAAIRDMPDATNIGQILENVKADLAQSPQPERLEVFDGVLAQETQTRALYAILASWLAIMLYLWFRFGNWTFGLAAVICLIHDLCFTLGVIAACHYLFATPVGFVLGLQDFKIDLHTVAALLTLVGYSVNDTIVVFDRIREVRGKNPLLTEEMINKSVNQTLSRTILASATTWLVVVVLYIFGGEGVHLFSFVMVVGVLVGTYSSIYVASPLLLWLGEGKAVAPSRPGQLARAGAVPGRSKPNADADADD